MKVIQIAFLLSNIGLILAEPETKSISWGPSTSDADGSTKWNEVFFPNDTAFTVDKGQEGEIYDTMLSTFEGAIRTEDEDTTKEVLDGSINVHAVFLGLNQKALLELLECSESFPDKLKLLSLMELIEDVPPPAKKGAAAAAPPPAAAVPAKQAPARKEGTSLGPATSLLNAAGIGRGIPGGLPLLYKAASTGPATSSTADILRADRDDLLEATQEEMREQYNDTNL